MYGDIWKDGFVKLDLRNAKMFGSRYDKCLTAIVYRGTRVICNVSHVGWVLVSRLNHAILKMLIIVIIADMSGT